VEAGPPRRRGINAIKPQRAQIERIDEGVNRANRVLLVDPIVKTLRQQRRLPTICPFDEPLHDHPRRIIEGIIEKAGLFHTARARSRHCRSHPADRALDWR
jgi:hypothetical protein